VALELENMAFTPHTLLVSQRFFDYEIHCNVIRTYRHGNTNSSWKRSFPSNGAIETIQTLALRTRQMVRIVHLTLGLHTLAFGDVSIPPNLANVS